MPHRRCRGLVLDPSSSRSTSTNNGTRSRRRPSSPLVLMLLLAAAAGAGPRVAAAAVSSAAAAQPRSLLQRAFILAPGAASSTRRRVAAAGAAAPASTAYSSLPNPAAAAAAAAADEVFDIPHFEATPATEADLQCIEERQLCHQVTCAGGPRKRCKHGFPQAFVFHPSKTSFNSGLFRLTCPLLVKAVDEYEAQGGLREFNAMMAQDPAMQREFRRVNARHSAIRRQLAEPEQLTPYIARLGPAVVEQILASGIAGVSPEKTEDLKCLHAHLADFLCTRDNGVGQRVYETLREKRGVEVDGCASCWQQCDVTHERTPESWWYTPVKNKQKLRSRYERRHKRKAEIRQQQGQVDEGSAGGEGGARAAGAGV